MYEAAYKGMKDVMEDGRKPFPLLGTAAPYVINTCHY